MTVIYVALFLFSLSSTATAFLVNNIKYVRPISIITSSKGSSHAVNKQPISVQSRIAPLKMITAAELSEIGNDIVILPSESGSS